MSAITRRGFVGVSAAAGLAAIVPDRHSGRIPAARATRVDRHLATTAGPRITLEAKPAAIELDVGKTALVVVDMQNDFGSEGGMFHRAGIDISMIHAAVAPTRRVLA